MLAGILFVIFTWVTGYVLFITLEDEQLRECPPAFDVMWIFDLALAGLSLGLSLIFALCEDVKSLDKAAGIVWLMTAIPLFALVILTKREESSKELVCRMWKRVNLRD